MIKVLAANVLDPSEPQTQNVTEQGASQLGPQLLIKEDEQAQTIIILIKDMIHLQSQNTSKETQFITLKKEKKKCQQSYNQDSH